jgi:hypothetical protein
MHKWNVLKTILKFTLKLTLNGSKSQDKKTTTNVNFNVNFKNVFKTIQLCISWWIKKKTLIISRCTVCENYPQLGSFRSPTRKNVQTVIQCCVFRSQERVFPFLRDCCTQLAILQSPLPKHRTSFYLFTKRIMSDFHKFFEQQILMPRHVARWTLIHTSIRIGGIEPRTTVSCVSPWRPDYSDSWCLMGSMPVDQISISDSDNSQHTRPHDY